MSKPFVLLFEEAVRKTFRLCGQYDESRDMWFIEEGNKKVPVVESEPFLAGTRTKKEEVEDRDDVDVDCFSI